MCSTNLNCLAKPRLGASHPPRRRKPACSCQSPCPCRSSCPGPCQTFALGRRRRRWGVLAASFAGAYGCRIVFAVEIAALGAVALACSLRRSANPRKVSLPEAIVALERSCLPLALALFRTRQGPGFHTGLQNPVVSPMGLGLLARGLELPRSPRRSAAL